MNFGARRPRKWQIGDTGQGKVKPWGLAQHLESVGCSSHKSLKMSNIKAMDLRTPAAEGEVIFHTE